MSDLVCELKLPAVVLAVLATVWTTARYAGPASRFESLPPISAETSGWVREKPSNAEPTPAWPPTAALDPSEE